MTSGAKRDPNPREGPLVRVGLATSKAVATTMASPVQELPQESQPDAFGPALSPIGIVGLAEVDELGPAPARPFALPALGSHSGVAARTGPLALDRSYLVLVRASIASRCRRCACSCTDWMYLSCSIGTPTAWAAKASA